MNYPTVEEVERNRADKVLIAKWCRHLPSAKDDQEVAVMNMILAAHRDNGGWNPTLSKAVGWEFHE